MFGVRCMHFRHCGDERIVTARARMRRALAVLLAAALAVAACVGPSRTDEDFRHKAANTAESVQGVIGTVKIAVGAAAHGHVPAPYLSVVIAAADDDASSIADTFDSVQPPGDTADELRSRLDDVLQQVVSTLDDLRVAVRRGQLRRLPELAQPLQQLNRRLQRIVDSA